MQTINDTDLRKLWLDEILGDENKRRKAESFRRSEVYNKRQGPFVEAKLKTEFSEETVQDMRKIYSINIAKRVTDKMAALYNDAPERTFSDDMGEPLSEEQVKGIEALYSEAKVNYKLGRANRVKKYQQQCILQVIPVLDRGIIDVRVLQPHQVDVIPSDSDPERAFAYVINAYDRSYNLTGGDMVDQKIADRNDQEGKKRDLMRFVWWSAEHNFITDGNGRIVQDDQEDILNPIGTLPFIDIADEKEQEFWVRKGSSIIDFAVDFSTVICDTATINRLQGYAQGVIKSVERPKDVRVGPNQFIWLQLDPNATVQPDLQFATPNPDMQASLDLQDRLINYFLTSEGLDPKVVNSKSEGVTYSSGFERMLAMLEQFEASKEDIDQFKWIESELFKLFVLWNNHYAGASNSPMNQSLQFGQLPVDSQVNVVFFRPEMIQSKTEADQAELALLEKGLRSPVQALANIDRISEEEAMRRLEMAKEQAAMLTAGEPQQAEGV